MKSNQSNMPNKTTSLAIYFVLATVLFCFCGWNADVFGIMFMLMFLAAAVVITLLVIIIDLLGNTKFFIYPGITTLALILGFIILQVVASFKKDRIEKSAQLIISNIDKYQKNHGQLPESIEALNLNIETEEFNYYIDRKGNYSVSYSLDGWHQTTYDSDRKEWYGHD